MVKIGLIGAGNMAGLHANCYMSLDNVEVVAVADVRKEYADELAEKLGCKAYYSGDELIENAEVDAVDICLPTFLHAPHAIKAMEKGMDVFIEKPVAINAEACEALLEAEKRTGAKVMVGHVIRLWEEYAWLKDAADSGKYGKIRSAVFKRVSPSVTWAWENWFNNPERSGGAPLDLHIHDVDFMRFLMGEPTSYHSRADRNKETGAITQIFTTFEYGDVPVFVEACWDYPKNFPFTMAYTVKFEKATIEYNSNVGTVDVYPVDGDPEKITVEKALDVEAEKFGNLSAISPYFRELKYFTECVENDSKIEMATLSDSVKSAKLIYGEMEAAGGVIKK